MSPRYVASASHSFSDFETLPFSASQYSRLKFGSDFAARHFGHELAKDTFAKHADILLSNRCVVIPSPYNVVPNAATILARHFMNKLNQLIVEANGQHVDWSIIHRKVSYTTDYGFLSKEKRKGLLDNDLFFLNRGYLDGKLLIFIDDVKITGTHEEKLIEILKRDQVPNDAMFLYVANYEGQQADIEAKLNFAGIRTLEEYLRLSQEPNHHVIVRPIKFLLSQPQEDFRRVLNGFSDQLVEELYSGCLGEGYYAIPQYQPNFLAIADRLKEVVA